MPVCATEIAEWECPECRRTMLAARDSGPWACDGGGKRHRETQMRLVGLVDGVRNIEYRRLDASTWEVTTKTYTPSVSGKIRCCTEVECVFWHEMPDDVRSLVIRSGARVVERAGSGAPVAVEAVS